MDFTDTSLSSPSGRIVLLSPTATYDAHVGSVLSHPATRRYLPFLPEYCSTEDARIRREKRFRDERSIDFNIFLRVSDADNEPCNAGLTFVGICGLIDIDRDNSSCAVGILVHPSHHRSGIATEALLTLMQFAFEHESLHMHRVAYETGVDNVQMRGWLESAAGITLECRYREVWRAGGGKWVDAVVFSVLEDEWRGSVRRKLQDRLKFDNAISVAIR